MVCIYEAMENAQEAINKSYHNNENRYKWQVYSLFKDDWIQQVFI